MKYYKINDLTQTLGVTRQAIDYVLKKQNMSQYVSTQEIDGKKVKCVDQKGYEKLKQHFHKTSSKKNNNINDINHLLSEIEHLREENKNLHIELQHEQVLHLQDKQELSNLKKEINLNKNSLELEQNNNQETKQKKRHWWNFWS